MLMKIKRMISLDISVAESEVKPDARASHPLVGGVATSALMKLPISSSNLRNLAKLSGHLAVKKALTIYFSVHTIINSSHNRPSSYSHTAWHTFPNRTPRWFVGLLLWCFHAAASCKSDTSPSSSRRRRRCSICKSVGVLEWCTRHNQGNHPLRFPQEHDG